MMTNTLYCIRCRVSGGRTGTRESYLKKDGLPQIFSNYQDADALARRLDRQANHAFATAYFEYWVEAVQEWVS